MRAAGEVMRQRIVRGIQELTTRNNRPPTNRELGEYLGGKSTGHIDYHLRILREQRPSWASPCAICPRCWPNRMW